MAFTRLTSVRQVGDEEVPRAVSTLLSAFIADPIMRYMWPEASAYMRYFPRLVDGFGGGAFKNDGADVTEDFAGGALWLPPGVHPDEEALGALMAESLAENVLSDMMPTLEQMDASHPKETHWHLSFIGTDAAHQGRGIGGDLMKDRLAKIDALGHHAYLESSNPRNVGFYQRHGFEVIREIQFGDAPPIIPMVRKP